MKKLNELNERVVALKATNAQTREFGDMFATGTIGEPMYDEAKALGKNGGTYLLDRTREMSRLPHVEYTKLAQDIKKYRDLGYNITAENIFYFNPDKSKFKGKQSELRTPNERGFHICNVEPHKNNHLTTEDFIRQIDFSDETGLKSIEAVAGMQSAYIDEASVREQREIEYYSLPFKNEIFAKAKWDMAALGPEARAYLQQISEKALNGAMKCDVKVENRDFLVPDYELDR